MVEAYRNSVEHLADELKLLDMQLGYAISRFLASNERQQWNEYSGLYISEKEIENALRRDVTEYSKADDNSTFSPHSVNGIAHLKEIIQKRKEQSEKEGVLLNLQNFSKALSLSPFEVSIIIICLAPEIDSKYEKIYAYLHNDVTRKKPSMGLVLDLLCYSMQEKIDSRRFFMQSNLLLDRKAHV